MLPGRIGSNCALDAAVDAFCCALANLHNRQLESDTYAALYSPDSRRAFARHGHALTTLRTALDDAALARAPETVCAIYLILITEVCFSSNELLGGSH